MKFVSLFYLCHFVLALDQLRLSELQEYYKTIFRCQPSKNSLTKLEVIRHIANVYFGPGTVLICHESPTSALTPLFATLDETFARVSALKDLSLQSLTQKYGHTSGEKVATANGGSRKGHKLEMAFHVYRASYRTLHNPKSLVPLIGLQLPDRVHLKRNREVPLSTTNSLPFLSS
jgi:hypothetical protein